MEWLSDFFIKESFAREIVTSVFGTLFFLGPFILASFYNSKDKPHNSDDSKYNAERIDENGKCSLPTKGSIKENFSERDEAV